MGLKNFIKNMGRASKTAAPKAPVAYTPQPSQSDRGAREYGASGSIIPKQWSHVYGEHDAATLRFLACKEPTVYSAIKKVISEKNRRGWQWTEKYAAVCPDCGKEFPTLPENKPKQPMSNTPPSLPGQGPPSPQGAQGPPAPPSMPQEGQQPMPGPSPPAGQPTPEGQDIGEDIYYCDEPDCEGELRVPDPEAYKEAEKLLLHPIRTDRKVSFNTLQNLHDYDVLTLGNGYMIAVMRYHIAKDGTIIENKDIVVEDEVFTSKPVGLMYVPEEYVLKVEDDFGNKGGKYWVCMHCRDTQPQYRAEQGDVYTKRPPAKCSYCSRTKLYDVHIIVNPNGVDQGDGTRYYTAEEYYWTPFFPTSLRFSFAPIETLSDLLLIKIYGYRYWLNIYKTQQSNNVLKWVASTSFNAFKEFIAFVKKSFEKKEEVWVWA